MDKLLGACMLLSVMSSFLLTLWYPDVAFYTIPSRFWELAAGALVREVEHKTEFRLVCAEPSALSRWMIMLLQFVASCLLVVALFATPEKQGFPYPFALLPVGGTACFILAGLAPTSLLNTCFGHRGLVYIGKLSYPVYLWHWPVIVLSDTIFGKGFHPLAFGVAQ